ncbi:hypothetical protein SEA_CECE_58 [Microbacterium phage Cece]|nr:hypothetical protein SEA_CECE_58 [Microbacterium phage Cece]
MSDMTDESTELLPGALDAAEYVLYHIDQLRDAKTLGEQADAFVALQNAAADLKSFHPEFDANNGTMPWDREDQEARYEVEIKSDGDLTLQLAEVEALSTARDAFAAAMQAQTAANEALHRLGSRND